MLYISHRGNLDGINKEFENKPPYILNALKKKFNVEVDIWFKKGEFFLGHDEPENLINYEFIQKKTCGFMPKILKHFMNY